MGHYFLDIQYLRFSYRTFMSAPTKLSNHGCIETMGWLVLPGRDPFLLRSSIQPQLDAKPGPQLWFVLPKTILFYQK